MVNQENTLGIVADLLAPISRLRVLPALSPIQHGILLADAAGEGPDFSDAPHLALSDGDDALVTHELNLPHFFLREKI